MDTTNWKAARQRYAQYASPDFTPENAYITAYTSPGYANFGAQPDMYVPPGSSVMPTSDPYASPAAPAAVSPTLANAVKKARHRQGHHGGGHGGHGGHGGGGGGQGQGQQYQPQAVGQGQGQGGGGRRGLNWIQQRAHDLRRR